MKFRKIVVRWNDRKKMWVRFCPHCPERYQVDYWLTWNGAMNNAHRHVLSHRFNGSSTFYGARAKAGS